MVIKDPAMP